MSEEISVSVVVPVFNGFNFIKSCSEILSQQTFNKKKCEVIMIDDGSTDTSLEEIKKIKLPNFKFFRNKENAGVSVARNIGIEKSIGEYIYFMDVDDTIDKDAITILYSVAKKYDCDYVFSDYKRISNFQNERANTFIYEHDKIFDKNKLFQYMKKEIYNPSGGHLGLFGCNGRLIKKSILKKNNIFFEKKLRYFEDKLFSWDLFKYINSARYIRNQLYSYNVRLNEVSSVTTSITNDFKVEYFKLVANKIKSSFEFFKVKDSHLEELVNQSLIFYIITLLVSYSRSLEQEKVDYELGKKARRKIINEILNDSEIVNAAKKYRPSSNESKLIPFAISLRSRFLLELSCTLRAKEVVKLRQSGKQ